MNLNESVKNLGKKYGYLPYMIERFEEMLGKKETIELLHFNEIKIPKFIRLNSLRESFDNIIRLLNKKGVEFREFPDLPEGREIIKTNVPIGATAEYLNGYYILQGKNSLYPSKILNPKQGELVGDFAAAPGGKTSHLAQIMKNTGNIIALELSANRCRSLRSNLARMGVKNTTVLQMDARRIARLNLSFDKILLDAPCSGSGIIVTDEKRKNSTNLEEVENYTSYQEELLIAAINVLKVGGELVYCTCSLEPEENELVISNILDKTMVNLQEVNLNADHGLQKFNKYSFNTELKKTRRLYPHKTKGEGFFIAKMVKVK